MAMMPRIPSAAMLAGVSASFTVRTRAGAGCVAGAVRGAEGAAARARSHFGLHGVQLVGRLRPRCRKMSNTVLLAGAGFGPRVGRRLSACRAPGSRRSTAGPTVPAALVLARAPRLPLFGTNRMRLLAVGTRNLVVAPVVPGALCADTGALEGAARCGVRLQHVDQQREEGDVARHVGRSERDLQHAPE